MLSLYSDVVYVRVFTAVCGGCSQTFTSDGLFIVPNTVSSVRAIAVGGGAGGSNANEPGGGGGYVRCGTFNVTSGASIFVVVGAGGVGGPAINAPTPIIGSDGGSSSFGSLLSAPGGQSCLSITATSPGCNGGSGSGAACRGVCSNSSYTGAGGTGGSNGQGANSGDAGGIGQGTANYTSCLQLALHHNLASGKGGAGSLTFWKSGNWGASGGGGGVLLDDNGPAAQDGKLLLLI